jgi:hypothetical protein
LILVSCAIANSRIAEVREIRRRIRRGLRGDTMDHVCCRRLSSKGRGSKATSMASIFPSLLR